MKPRVRPHPKGTELHRPIPVDTPPPQEAETSSEEPPFVETEVSPPVEAKSKRARRKKGEY